MTITNTEGSSVIKCASTPARLPVQISTEALLRLLAWLSPAFPTGGFAYSHGIEWAVEAGDIRDEASLAAWLATLLRHGSGRNDAILLRLTMRAESPEAIAELAEACAGCAERRLETLAQGGAFLHAAAAWGAATPSEDIAYPVAVGILARAHGIAERAAVAAYLQALTANWISAAVRLVPLGQSAGLRVLAASEPAILAVVAETEDATEDDIGGAAFRADIASMRHETQYTRLFRT